MHAVALSLLLLGDCLVCARAASKPPAAPAASVAQLAPVAAPAPSPATGVAPLWPSFELGTLWRVTAANGAQSHVLGTLHIGQRADLAVPDQAWQALSAAQRLIVEVQHDANAGLARVALAEGDIRFALGALQPMLDLVARGGTLEGTESTRLIELTVHQTLARANDPRAAEWLARAHTALMIQADAISHPNADPALRHGFLQDIPHRREILAAWVQRADRSS